MYTHVIENFLYILWQQTETLPLTPDVPFPTVPLKEKRRIRKKKKKKLLWDIRSRRIRTSKTSNYRQCIKRCLVVKNSLTIKQKQSRVTRSWTQSTSSEKSFVLCTRVVPTSSTVPSVTPIPSLSPLSSRHKNVKVTTIKSNNLVTVREYESRQFRTTTPLKILDFIEHTINSKNFINKNTTFERKVLN